MKLAELENLQSFALLGPGFSDDRFLLLRDLRPTEDAPLLVFARFEEPGASALKLAAGSVTPCAVEFDDNPRPLDVVLAAPDYAVKVGQIREAIACGDVYQVCLTVRALVSESSGADLLSLMCRRGVPRFAAWVRLPDGSEFVSASPELFFETDGRQVHAEPMKGTASPSAGGVLDASEKDRAELAMITDMVRNDLAHVCRQKTIRVANQRRVLQLPYALQTVSDIVGVLDDGKTALDILAALHPGGSVTGAPKQAALAMIGRLEPDQRGAYCGALGLLTGERSVFSLLIRTAARSAQGWVYGVGSGIVYDSDPRAELEELRVKMGALIASSSG
jgi:Anthranilate/para-aminobenzoate synthases component I